jgi:hypothetical protein
MNNIININKKGIANKDNLIEMTMDKESTTKLALLLLVSIIAAFVLGLYIQKAEGATQHDAHPPSITRINVDKDIMQEDGVLIAIQLADKDDVDIFLNSDGGSYEASKVVMELIMERNSKGKKTRCYATKAISGAFMMFAACSERIALPGGRFMMHYPYILIPRVTVFNVGALKDDLLAEKLVVDKWIGELFNTKALIMLSYLAEEKYMSGIELCSTFTGFCKTEMFNK